MRPGARPFLTARWSDVLLLSFEAPEEVLRPLVPPPLELDRWKGRTHVSLVALRMTAIRIRGWRIPGFAAHPQVNFRTYTRHGPDPAVVFVRELVPSRIIAAVGRLRYSEPFQVARIEARVSERAGGGGVRAEYRFGPDAPRYRVAVSASPEVATPPDGSFEHYLKERTRACRSDPRGRGGRGRLRTFRVEHPRWAVREVTEVDYDVDFEALYGKEWAFLNTSTPASVILAVGSDVAVYPRRSV